jgi:hypothetical protein
MSIIRAELEEEFAPSGMERELVERLAVQMWRMGRIPIFEAALIEVRRAHAASNKRLARMGMSSHNVETEPPYEHTSPRPDLDSQKDTLGKLLRYEAALMNAFNRTLQQLLFLQDRRARDEDETQVVDVLPSPSNGRDTASQ